MENIKTYLNNLTFDSKKRITNHFKLEVEEIALLVSKITTPLQNYISTIKTPFEDNPKFVGYGLMTKGVNTLMAALELSLNGYFWEPPILLRNALEGFTSAWDIIHNPSRFKIWQVNKKFKSTDSISKAKEINKVIGPLYGLLSNMYTHIKQINASPSLVFIEEEPKLQFFGLVRKGKENIRESEIYLCLIVTYMCLQMAELCFYQYSNGLETIELIPGKLSVKTKVTDRHKKFVDKSLKIFENLKNNPLKNL